MRKRYLYAILFGIPGLILAAILAALAAGMAGGVFWLFVFGDNPWPDFANRAITSLFVLVFLLAWAATLAGGYAVGKRLERNPGLNKLHVLAALGLALALILAALLQQWRLGNLGPKSDETLCSDYCSRQGYSASSLPPRNSGDRTCSCLDASGHASLKVPLEQLVPTK